MDDRHEPERRAGQPDAPRRVRHARRRGASDHPLRPRLPLPVARMDQHLQGERVDPVDEREGLLPGQRGRGRVLRASQAGVLPRARLRRRHHQGVHRTTGRIHDLVPGREDHTHFRHQHRQTKTRARTHGIIKEQGHRSPTKRHHPQRHSLARQNLQTLYAFIRNVLRLQKTVKSIFYFIWTIIATT